MIILIRVLLLIINKLKLCKLLGLQLDDKLDFNLHISNISKSASNQLNALIRLKKLMNLEEKKIDKQLFYGKLQLFPFRLDAIQGH